VLHGRDDGPLVAHALSPALLTPAHDDEQRVVDGDRQADQGDQELDDDRDIGRTRQRPDQQEGRRDGDQSHEERHQGHERSEDEGQDQQGAAAGDQGLERETRPTFLATVCSIGAQGVQPGHLDRRSAHGDAVHGFLCRACLGLARIDAALGRDVDQGERRTSVL
jgi:hypothetical protein